MQITKESKQTKLALHKARHKKFYDNQSIRSRSQRYARFHKPGRRVELVAKVKQMFHKSFESSGSKQKRFFLRSFDSISKTSKQSSLTENSVESEALQLIQYLEDPNSFYQNVHLVDGNEIFNNAQDAAIDSGFSMTTDFGFWCLNSSYSELLSGDIYNTDLHIPPQLSETNIELIKAGSADNLESSIMARPISSVAVGPTGGPPIYIDAHQILTPVAPLLESNYVMHSPSPLNAHDNLEDIGTYICGTCWTYPRVFSEMTNVSGNSSTTPEVTNISQRREMHKESYEPNPSSDEFYNELFKRYEDFENADSAVGIRAPVESGTSCMRKDPIDKDVCKLTSSARLQNGYTSSQLSACKSASELQFSLKRNSDLANSNEDLTIHMLNCPSTIQNDVQSKHHPKICSEESQITHHDSSIGIEKEPNSSSEAESCTVFEKNRKSPSDRYERKLSKVVKSADHKNSTKQNVKLILDSCIQNEMNYSRANGSTKVLTAESMQTQQLQEPEVYEMGAKTIIICKGAVETLQGIKMDTPPFLKHSCTKVQQLFEHMGSRARSKISKFKKKLVLSFKNSCEMTLDQLL